MSNAAPRTSTTLVVPFEQITEEMAPLVGGKTASLAMLQRSLTRQGIRVADGFAVTVDAWYAHLRAAGIDDEIQGLLDALDVTDVAALEHTGALIRKLVASAPLPDRVGDGLASAYERLSRRYGEHEVDVAVRSSATAEDLPTASFAGQQETLLNVRGAQALELAVRRCMASLYTNRAIVYRAERDIPHRDVALSVAVQKMVRSDLASAGVVFTLDTESGFRDVVLVTGAWGLGESVVQGRTNPDEYWVHKPTLERGFASILRRELGDKARRLVYDDGGTAGVREERVPRDLRERFVLGEDEVLQLARWAVLIEDHYSEHYGRPTPMDLEWAKDGRTGELFILQARPETVHGHEDVSALEIHTLQANEEPVLTGRSVGARVGAGPVRVVHDASELRDFEPGDVLVAEMTDPDWEPVLARAAAVVTDRGGRTCHAAIVSRELGIPCVVGTDRATAALRDGQRVTVSCAEGDVGRVYDGEVPFERHVVRPEEIPEPPVPLQLNLADPGSAFGLSRLPAAGVGLVRVEFLVNNWIGVHPMACAHLDRVSDRDVRAEIRRRSRPWESPSAFFVERMASGIAVIAAAFWPRPVLVRFSDFKSNEYAHLLGGAEFEPDEANPMIGFRGASRYYDERYRDGFALECRAVERVRATMGLTNVRVMIPFCRTLDEGRRVLEEMVRHGLERGRDGLEVWVMCEIPNNVVLAEEFAELFDGFSIGSNDLTQLILGVDRDSSLLSHIFSERDPGVRRMIAAVIDRAHRKGRDVGLCGQAPSDDPDFAQWLVEQGIDSLSLTPDSLPRVAMRLASR